MQFTCLIGVQHWAVKTSVCCVINYKHVAPLCLSPVLLQNHVASSFQGFIGVLLTSHQLLDGSNIELPEIKWVLGDVPIEGRLIQQDRYQVIG